MQNFQQKTHTGPSFVSFLWCVYEGVNYSQADNLLSEHLIPGWLFNGAFLNPQRVDSWVSQHRIHFRRQHPWMCTAKSNSYYAQVTFCELTSLDSRWYTVANTGERSVRMITSVPQCRGHMRMKPRLPKPAPVTLLFLRQIRADISSRGFVRQIARP